MDDGFENVWGDAPSSPPPISSSRSFGANVTHPQPLPLSSTVPLDLSAFDTPTDDDGDVFATPSASFTSSLTGHDDPFSAAPVDDAAVVTPRPADYPLPPSGSESSSHDDDAFTSPSAFPEDDGFGEFGDPPPIQANAGDDDDFGDFGDFGDAVVAEPFDADDQGGFDDFPASTSVFAPPQPAISLPPEPGPSNWRPLRLDPLPNNAELIQEVGELLYPVFGVRLEDVTSDEPIRQVGGLAQVLVAPSSREFYNALLNPDAPPSMRAPNWTRSRIRRQHLIALGIPVNLDEVLPAQPPSKAMPLMHITTGLASGQARPMSAPPGAMRAANGNGSRRTTGGRESQSRVQTPQRSPERGGGGTNVARRGGANAAAALAALGPKPEWDRARIDNALGLTADRLALLPTSTLSAHVDSIRSLMSSTSDLLTYVLQEREALQQDSDQYNKLIAELVSEAQKQKMGTRGKPVKRGSTNI